MIVVGTAGHIDHGKSAIVKCLTGTDPDRLPEEKARGMTIDLGFAFYRTPSGTDVAFVDVPGHERFVKNMIAGAGGIDVAMLVVAADDGWMPQSQEHFQVMRLLGITDGLIVINKIDLVEEDWLELLQQDIKQKVQHSFLADSPVFEVSAQTGQGLDSLRRHLDSLAGRHAAHKDIGKARMFIDRSFVRPGIGRVVTGTLRGGSLTPGQTTAVWPSMQKAKIRSLQSRNQDLPRAVPGQRTAVSFTGIEKEALVRGGVVCDRLDLGFFRDNPVLALSVELVGESPVSLKNRRRILFMVGTTEMEGEVRLLHSSEIRPGARGIIFFKPDQPTYCLVGDHYIARLPTPMVTLGGGRVLDHRPRFPRRKDVAALDYLSERLTFDVDDLVLSELHTKIAVGADALLAEAAVAHTEVGSAVSRLVESQAAGRFGEYVFHTETMAEAVERLTEHVHAYLQERPHLSGLTIEQLERVSPLNPDSTRLVTRYLVAVNRVTKTGDIYNLTGRDLGLKGAVKEAHDDIMRRLQQAPYAPPPLTQLSAGGKHYKEAIKYIIDSKEAYKCGSEFLFVADVWKEILQFIRQRLNSAESMAVTELRDRFGFTRKFAIPVLEQTDRSQLTRRRGDVRVRGERFDSEEFDL